MKYLDWVRKQPCSINDTMSCMQNRIDAHHLIGHGTKGMGLRSPDTLSMPLCRSHHDELHRHGHQSWEEKYGSQWKYVALSLAQYLTGKG